MPNLNIGFLVCGYLPGLPIAFAVYYAILVVHSDADLVKYGTSDKFWVTYLLIAPLVFGLLLDGIRHGIGILLQAYNTGKDKKIINFFIWQKISYNRLGKINDKQLIKEIYEKHLNHYHMFEFSYNMFISNIFLILILYCIPNNQLWNYVLVFFVIAIASLFSGLAYKKENDLLLEQLPP